MLQPRSLGVGAALMTVSLCLGSCGGDGASPKNQQQQPPVIIEITEDAGSITPDDGHAVKVARGQEIRLVVTSDEDDEIHVHSVPAQHFEIKAASAETFTFDITTPGSYGVESHGLDVTLVKLQVS